VEGNIIYQYKIICTAKKLINIIRELLYQKIQLISNSNVFENKQVRGS
jgi:hypothetical protein